MTILEDLEEIERNLRMAGCAGEHFYWKDIAKNTLKGLSPQSLTFEELAAAVDLCYRADVDSRPFLRQMEFLKERGDSLEQKDHNQG